MMTKRRPKRSKRVPVPLHYDSAANLRQRLTARLACSEPWAMEIVAWIDQGRVDLFVDDHGYLRADFAKVEKQLRRAGCYPPNGLMTLMYHCPRCDHWTPMGIAQRVRDDSDPHGGDHCEECMTSNAPEWLWSQWPASPSAMAIQRARILGVRLRQGRLGQA